jgi:hypothetical protein
VLGAWDYGALDNDAALDVVERWEALADVPLDAVVAEFLERWGDALNYGDSTTNMAVIALAALVRRAGHRLPKPLRMACQDALNRELLPSSLDAWEDPSRREEALLAMLADIGGKRRKPRGPKAFKASQIRFANTQAAHDELMRLAAYVRPAGLLGLSDVMYPPPPGPTLRLHTSDPLPGLAPDFLRALHRLVQAGLAETDWNLADQALRERRMMLAWYIGLTSLMPLEDIEALITRMEGKGW